MENGKVPQKEEKKEIDDYEDFEEDEAPSSKLLDLQIMVVDYVKNHKCIIKNIILFALLMAYFVYFGYAMYYEFGSAASIQLLWMTIVGVILILIFKFNLWSKTFGRLLSKRKPMPDKVSLGLSW